MLRNYLKVASVTYGNPRVSPLLTSSASLPASASAPYRPLRTDELSYDRFNVNADRIYRVDDDINSTYPADRRPSPKPLGVTMVNNYPR